MENFLPFNQLMAAPATLMPNLPDWRGLATNPFLRQTPFSYTVSEQPMSLRSLRIIWCDLRGSVLVEGTLLLPMLFVVFFGVFEFSWYFYQQHKVSTGVREAARYVARSDNLGWPPTIPSAVHDAAQNLATTGDTSGSCPTSCRVAGWTPGLVSITRPAPVVDAQGVSVYNVLVSTTFTPPSLGFLGFLGLGQACVVTTLCFPDINVSHYERLIPPPSGII